MPDQTHSTTPVSSSTAQDLIAEIADDLAQLDDRLSAVAAAMRPEPGWILLEELRVGTESVSTDLLADAVVTLSALATLTEAAALDRRVEAISLVERIAASG